MDEHNTEDLLFFSNADSFSVRRLQEEAALREISNMEKSQILNGSIEDLVNFIHAKFFIKIPILDIENAEASQQEVKISVQAWRDEQQMSVLGTMVTLEVPYEGEKFLFRIKPSTWSLNPPRASISKTRVILRQSGRNLKSEEVQASFEQTIASIQENLLRLHSDFDEFNNRLKDIAREQIEARKSKLLADQNLVSGLKFKLKERSGAPMTYAAPVQRKKIEPRLPVVTAKEFKPEPTLLEEDYQHILKIIHDMTLVMERSPTSFATMGEEDIRQHFLVQLNGQYEGKATGETFNAEGKTDILVRHEGRNIFIAECKFWRGDKGYTDTIDQLLGYLSWRDTKAAIIIFNRNKVTCSPRMYPF